LRTEKPVRIRTGFCFVKAHGLQLLASAGGATGVGRAELGEEPLGRFVAALGALYLPVALPEEAIEVKMMAAFLADVLVNRHLNSYIPI
jgi:hypothetical protein